MFDPASLNPFAVLVAWLINMFVGAYWYSPAGFSNQWTKLTGIDIMKLPKNEANRALGFVAGSALVQAVGLALVVQALGARTIGDGLVTGLVLWAGLTAATTVGTTFYSERGWSFWWLNASYFLTVMSVNSIMLAVWR